jgi:hypothetical protein
LCRLEKFNVLICGDLERILIAGVSIRNGEIGDCTAS